ncbi:MAG: UDP-N-acetylmuramate dehydrogenase [bacterium]
MKRLRLIEKSVKGTFIFDEPMANHTSFRIGGKAEALFLPHSEEDILQLTSILEAENIPYYFLGNGTNILVSDKGLKGVVIKLGGHLKGIDPKKKSILAGTPLPSVLNTLTKLGLSGLEKLAGIPGTVGGAIKMNAGIPFFTIGEAVQSVRVFQKGQVFWLSKQDIVFSYRQTSLKDFLVLEAVFNLTPSPPSDIRKNIEEILRRRKLSQPTRAHSAGCIFKNPPGTTAGELLEKAGAKGMRYGDAYISHKHANFIINRGNATAKDVYFLIKKCKELVREKFGIELELEIELWGEFP